MRLSLYVYRSVCYPSVCAVVEAILKRAHDVQLGTHPAWMRDRQRVHMWQYSLDEQREILGVGAALLLEWTGKAPLAHRAGAFGADLSTLVALKRAGIPVDSSSRPGRLNCRLEGRANQITEHNGVVEVPITGFEYEMNCRLAGHSLCRRQLFTLLGLDSYSPGELQWFLDLISGSRVPILHLGLHSYSFIKWDSRRRYARWNPVDYDKLVTFLRKSRGLLGVQWITLNEF